jgi:hypothetical protein
MPSPCETDAIVALSTHYLSSGLSNGGAMGSLPSKWAARTSTQYRACTVVQIGLAGVVGCVIEPGVAGVGAVVSGGVGEARERNIAAKKWIGGGVAADPSYVGIDSVALRIVKAE